MNVIKQQKADFLASVTKNKNPKNTIPFRSDRVFGELADVNSYQIRQHNATARGVWFDISFSEYRQLREQKKCFYTGIDLLLTDEIPTKEKTPPEMWTLDRVDSTKGYTMDNVVVCSHAANMMKNSFESVLDNDKINMGFVDGLHVMRMIVDKTKNFIDSKNVANVAPVEKPKQVEKVKPFDEAKAVQQMKQTREHYGVMLKSKAENVKISRTITPELQKFCGRKLSTKNALYHFTTETPTLAKLGEVVALRTAGKSIVEIGKQAQLSDPTVRHLLEHHVLGVLQQKAA